MRQAKMYILLMSSEDEHHWQSRMAAFEPPARSASAALPFKRTQRSLLSSISPRSFASAMRRAPISSR
jgi:hypothetical protein